MSVLSSERFCCPRSSALTWPAHHYLLHLLQPAFARPGPRTRIVFVSSGAVQMVKDVSDSAYGPDMLADSGTGQMPMYGATKFAHLLGAHWWRRQLMLGADGRYRAEKEREATVIAVSPGLIKDTGLGRHMKKGDMSFADAKTPTQGATSVLAAFERSDFPEDPDSIFLTVSLMVMPGLR